MFDYNKTLKAIQQIRGRQNPQNQQNNESSSEEEIEEKKEDFQQNQEQEINLEQIKKEKIKKAQDLNNNFLDKITFLTEQNIQLFQGEDRAQYEELLRQYNKFKQNKNYAGMRKFKNKLLDFCLSKQQTVQQLMEQIEQKKQKSKVQKQQLEELHKELDQSNQERDKTKLLLLQNKMQNLVNNRNKIFLRALQQTFYQPQSQQPQRAQRRQSEDKYIQAKVDSPPRNIFQRTTNFIKNKIRSYSRDENIFDPNKLQKEEIKRTQQEIQQLKKQLDQKEQIIRNLSRDILKFQNQQEVKDKFTKKDQSMLKDYESRYKQAVVERDDLKRRIISYDNQLNEERLTNQQQRQYFDSQISKEQQAKNQISRDYQKLQTQYQQSVQEADSENLKLLNEIENYEIQLDRTENMLQDREVRIRNLEQQVQNLERNLRNQQEIEQQLNSDIVLHNQIRESNERLIQQNLDLDLQNQQISQRIINLENYIQQQNDNLNNAQLINDQLRNENYQINQRIAQLEQEVLMLRNQQTNQYIPNNNDNNNQEEEQKEDIQSITESQVLQQKYNIIRNAMQSIQVQLQDNQIQNFIDRLENEFGMRILELSQQEILNLIEQYTQHLYENQQQYQMPQQLPPQIPQQFPQQIPQQFPQQMPQQFSNQQIVNRVYTHLTHALDNYNVTDLIAMLRQYRNNNQQNDQIIQNFANQLQQLNFRNITQFQPQILNNYRNILGQIYQYLQNNGYAYSRR